ncbi:ABC transporter permease [Castellaniella sp.]|uniref:ABC transporter permease n=1 Tax=Castellaniella sp. TaxID=1955812 RepID=UPI00355D37D5
MHPDHKPYSRSVLLMAVLTALFLLAPVVFIVIFAFHDGAYFVIPPTGFSFKWFENFFSNERFRHAMLVSFGIGALVTPLSLAISVPTAYALVRGRFPGRDAISMLIMSPLIVPGVVTGLAFLILMSALGIGPGFIGLMLGLTCFTLPFSVRALVANMHGLQPSMEEAARNLGAPASSVFWHVILPQLRPGLLAGGTFVFVEAIDNFSITVFLTTMNVTTLSVESYSYIRDFDDPTVAAMAAVLIALSTILVFVMNRLVGLEKMFRVE